MAQQRSHLFLPLMHFSLYMCSEEVQLPMSKNCPPIHLAKQGTKAHHLMINRKRNTLAILISSASVIFVAVPNNGILEARL